MAHISIRALSWAAAALLVATAAQAQGKGHQKDKIHGRDEQHGGAAPRSTYDIDRDRRRDDDRDRQRTYERDHGRNVYRDSYGNVGRVPPGLAKKPGQMPPGQYKKRYGANEGADVLGSIMRQRGYRVDRIVPSGESRYIYYRLRDGSERRAIVSPGADRLRFSNVPSSLLQEVLSRLY